MKKLTFIALAFLCLPTFVFGQSEQVYWVFLADKNGADFNPYNYFDAKAIERYQQCGADLYDQSNYPLVQQYVDGVDALATEEVGCSRWMNAMGVVATPEQASAISRLPYVVRVQAINSNMLTARHNMDADDQDEDNLDSTLTDQLLRMQGDLFRKAGIDGHGIRIAVFDGGFPKVNTHDAFKHLRDNGQILKTHNFPNHRENVYGWNSHGTMTLSCIAGRMDGKDLGLATGAEFLLARTEVNAEPFKEEVWWQMAVEWADKNGANIISSSLGYGKDRYYTKDMDGTSYVAKAANMAARKGILVVNSAGNEGDDKRWRYIITPSDADSVLCVGGTTHSLLSYEHIDFASYGPTADGRQKPNVCAFANTWAADPSSNSSYEMVYGTSFSCPLVAGFAACAWQTMRDKSAMEIFKEIERSADLYPYCDYAFGYGVPQASYFVDKENKEKKPTFHFVTVDSTTVSVVPVEASSSADIFFKEVRDDGSIIIYGNRSIEPFDSTTGLTFNGGRHLVVHYNGYTEDYYFLEPSDFETSSWCTIEGPDETATYDLTLHAPSLEPAKETRSEWDFYYQLGLPVKMASGELSSLFWSPADRFGLRWQYKFAKAYGIGLGLEYGVVDYYYGNKANKLEQLIGIDNIVNSASNRIQSRNLCIEELSIELYQRVRFVPGGAFHKGLLWDLGAYASRAWSSYSIKYKVNNDMAADSHKEKLTGLHPLSEHKLLYGVTTRLSYDVIGIYARYRLNGIGKKVAADKVELPRFEAGIQILF
ncbi:MAG: S8 family serine peptidase [Bacteroidales bacterium]|nr:S8 family serine peptidase [Bacteroidales bacterium]